MDPSTSWGMLTGKIPKSEEYHQMTAASQAHQVASQHDSPGGNIYNSFHQNAYNNSLANNTAAQLKDPRDLPSSTFRNPQASGLLSFFGGGSRLGDQPMTPLRFLTNLIPGVGLFRALQRASGNQPYEMHTQSGTVPGMTSDQMAAKYGPKVGASPQAAPAQIQDYGGYTPEPVETSTLSTYSGLPADMEAQYSASPAPLLAAPDVQLEAFTGQPSAGPEFDAFIEMTEDFPDFDGIRDNRDLMMDVFQKYKAMHGGAN